jgi:glutathione synthase
MQEAINMGIPTFWTASDFLFTGTSGDEVMAIKIHDISDLTDPLSTSPQPFPLSTFQQIHIRTDPPVDDAYRSLIDQLIDRGATKESILNPPQLLKYQSEKIPPSSLMQYAPKMMVVRSLEDLPTLKELFKNDAVIVSKPLHLAQSIGVSKHDLPTSNEGWNQLLSILTNEFTQPILIQEFLPGIANGEVRLWYAGNTLIGVMKKHPKTGDFRVLIDQGSKVSAYRLTASEQDIADEIGHTNASLGILMAAVDLIDEKICDYNITSPGLLMQLEEVNGGKNLARVVLNRALEYHAPAVHG